MESHGVTPGQQRIGAQLAQRRLLRAMSEQPRPRPLRRVPIDRDLEREHQARTLKVAREFEPRLSRADEQALADEARAKHEAARTAFAAELEREVLDALRAVERVAGRLSGDQREAAKAIRHHARRLRTYLDQLRFDR